MICEYCNHEFKSEKALKHHHNTAMYCLKLRNEGGAVKCDICNKELSKKFIKKHRETCKTNLINDPEKLFELFNKQHIEIEAYKNELDQLKEIIENKNIEQTIENKDKEINKLKQSLINKINELDQLDSVFIIKDNENYAYNNIIHQNELVIKEYETKANIFESIIKKYEEKLDQGDKEKIDAISKCINVLASKVGNTTNNTIKYSSSVNLVLSPEYLQEKLELYNEIHYSKGVAGVVEWAIEHVAPDIGYGCADIARGKFTFVAYEGGIEKGGVDMGGHKFKTAIRESLLPQMKKYSQKRMAEINKSGKSDNDITDLLIAEADLYDENVDLKHFSMYLKSM